MEHRDFLVINVIIIGVGVNFFWQRKWRWTGRSSTKLST